MQAHYTKLIACGVCAGKHANKKCENLDRPNCATRQAPHCVTDAGYLEYLKIQANIQQKAQENRRKPPLPALNI